MPTIQVPLRRATFAASLGLGATLIGGIAACGDQEAHEVPRREARAFSAMDAERGAGDQAIAEQIRKSVVENGALSPTARAVTIIAHDGIVTLRGSVKSEEEREAIVTAAESTPRVRRVDYQLEVKGKP